VTKNPPKRVPRARLALAVVAGFGLLVGLAPGSTGQALAQGARDDGGLVGPLLAARVASSRNDYAEAVAYLDRALDRDPQNAFLIESALIARIGLGDFEGALVHAEQLAGLGLDAQASGLLRLARDFRAAEYDAAIAALDAGPLGGPLVDGLARAWAELGRGRMSDALAAFADVIETEGMAVFGQFNKALALAHVGDVEGADLILSGEAAGALPLDRRGVIARLQILSQLDRQETAIELLDAAFGNEPDAELARLRADLADGAVLPFDMVTNAGDGLAEVLYMLAEVLRGDAGDEYTLMFARMAQYLRPDHVPALLLTGRMLSGLGQHHLAVETFDQVARDEAQYHVAQVGRADALFSAGDADTAIAAMETLIGTHGNFATIHVTLGDFLRRESRFDEASQAYDAAIELLGDPAPSHWVVYYTRAITHERVGRWPEAEADFRTALELNPEEPHVLNYLGYSLVERREKLDEALDMIERAVAGEPDNGYITDSLGWAFYRLGRYEEAVPVMERAVELATTDPVINDHLGDVYWAVGRTREARFQWRRALSYGPSDDLDMDRVRRKLEVGLDQVLIDEGAEPHLAGAHAN